MHASWRGGSALEAWGEHPVPEASLPAGLRDVIEPVAPPAPC